MKFGETGGKGSRAAAEFEDFGQSAGIIARFREIERNEYLLTNCESDTC